MLDEIDKSLQYWQETKKMYEDIGEQEKAKECQHNIDVLLGSKQLFQDIKTAMQ